jgi:tetratricopeptide (TPR) repeat protein
LQQERGFIFIGAMKLQECRFKGLFSLGALPVLAALFMTVGAANAQRGPAPVFDGLGHHHHDVTTRSAQAQRYFDQGLTLCYAFNHKEAIRSFEAVTKLDPACAMGHWGVAYAHGPHVNKPITKEENDRAWAAIQRALAGRAGVSPKEQAFIDAMAKRYQAQFAEDRSALDKAYAAAMREVVNQYPDDLDAQTLFAEALMDTMPWDYWTRDRSPKPETEEALAALRFVITRNVDHPGANHLYIHAVEAGPHPEIGLPSADRLANFTSQAGHLVHMPSHIYIRVGQYHDAVLANERAAKADQSYIRHCRAQGFYPGVYYPHNLHFLWWAQLFEGRSAEALRTANRVVEYAQDKVCGPTIVLEAPRFRHLPWITKARFGQWDDILRLAEPVATNDFLLDRAMWHFVRGLAFAARRQADDAAREAAALTRLVQSDEAKKLDNPQFPASSILGIASHLLAGKATETRGDRVQAIAHLEKAIAAEDALPYMEPTYWPYPTRPTLGAALLQSGDAVKAEQIFRDDLKRNPRNGWGLYGLEQSLRIQGKTQSADLLRNEFEQAWKHADVKLDLKWF